jgi:hypothetical protein
VFSHPFDQPFYLKGSSEQIVTFHSPSCSVSPGGSPNAIYLKTIQSIWLLLPGVSIFSHSLSVFQDFLSLLEGNTINVTDTNLTGLEGLCGEFGFTEFPAKVSEFHSSTSFKASEDADARGRIAALEEKAKQHDLRHCRFFFFFFFLAADVITARPSLCGCV